MEVSNSHWIKLAPSLHPQSRSSFSICVIPLYFSCIDFSWFCGPLNARGSVCPVHRLHILMVESLFSTSLESCSWSCLQFWVVCCCCCFEAAVPWVATGQNWKDCWAFSSFPGLKETFTLTCKAPNNYCRHLVNVVSLEHFGHLGVWSKWPTLRPPFHLRCDKLQPLWHLIWKSS